MVTTKMVPAIGLRPNRQARRFRRSKWPDQFLTRKLAVYRLRYRAIGQRQTRDPVPPAVGKFDEVMVDAECSPLFMLRRIIRRIFAKACCSKHTNQFRMTDVAMVTFAIILHHQFPVGVFDIIVLNNDL